MSFYGMWDKVRLLAKQFEVKFDRGEHPPITIIVSPEESLRNKLSVHVNNFHSDLGVLIRWTSKKGQAIRNLVIFGFPHSKMHGAQIIESENDRGKHVLIFDKIR